MASKIKDDNYIVVPARARLQYNLKGNDMLVYGIIHGFTHDNLNWKELSLQYVCDWIGVADKSRVSIIINRLVEAGAIEKEDYFINNVKFCKYRVKPLPDSGNHNEGVVESTTEGVVESTTNNIDNNTSGSIKNSKKTFEEKFDLSFVNVSFEETFKKWLRYKQERGEMYKTQMTLEENYRRLLKMANNDPWTAQQIVDFTISGGWMGYCMPKQIQQAYGNSSNTSTTSRAQQLAEELKRSGYQF